MVAECLHPPALRFVANRDEGFERRLAIEPFVLVDLVRTDRRFDRGVELHPRDIARVVVVGEERVGAREQEFLERRIGRELRGLAQQFRCAVELSLIFDTVGDGAETLAIAADRRKEAARVFPRLCGESVEPLLHVRLRGARWI